MDISPLTPKGMLIIERYGNHGFVVGGVPYKGNILILDGAVLDYPRDVNAPMPEDMLEALFAQSPELLLLGTGKSFARATPLLKDALREKHISIDAMDTGAACRTYNVLLSESRRVAALLTAVE